MTTPRKEKFRYFNSYQHFDTHSLIKEKRQRLEDLGHTIEIHLELYGKDNKSNKQNSI